MSGNRPRKVGWRLREALPHLLPPEWQENYRVLLQLEAHGREPAADTLRNRVLWPALAQQILAGAVVATGLPTGAGVRRAEVIDASFIAEAEADVVASTLTASGVRYEGVRLHLAALVAPELMAAAESRSKGGRPPHPLRAKAEAFARKWLENEGIPESGDAGQARLIDAVLSHLEEIATAETTPANYTVKQWVAGWIRERRRELGVK